MAFGCNQEVLPALAGAGCWASCYGSATNVMLGSAVSIAPRSAYSLATAGSVSILRKSFFQKNTSAVAKQCQVICSLGGGTSEDAERSVMFAQPTHSKKGRRLHIKQRPQSSWMIGSTL